MMILLLLCSLDRTGIVSLVNESLSGGDLANERLL